MFADLKGGTQYSYTVSCYGFKNEWERLLRNQVEVLKIRLERCDTKHTELTDNEWWNYRNSEENNGVTSVGTPNNPKETSEKWSLQIGGSWSESCTPPLILGDNCIQDQVSIFIRSIGKQARSWPSVTS